MGERPLRYCAPIQKKDPKKESLLKWIVASLALLLTVGMLAGAVAATVASRAKDPTPLPPVSEASETPADSEIPANSEIPVNSETSVASEASEISDLPSDEPSEPASESSELPADEPSETPDEPSEEPSDKPAEPEYVYESYTKPIPHETKYVETDDLEEGKTKVKQEGKDGVMKYSVKRIYDGDKIVEEHCWSEDVIEKPVTEIILKGIHREYTYETYTYDEEIKYKTVYEDTEDLPVGEEEVKQDGRNGLVRYTVKKTYVNGKKQGEEVVDKETVTEVRNKIIRRGVKKTVTVNGKTFGYLEAIEVKTTCYYKGEPGGDHSRTGKDLEYGMIAVDRSLIPLESKLYIDFNGRKVFENTTYDGIFYAEDTGGLIIGNKIDVYFESYDAAKTFNNVISTATVYILEEGHFKG